MAGIVPEPFCSARTLLRPYNREVPIVDVGPARHAGAPGATPTMPSEQAMPRLRAVAGYPTVRMGRWWRSVMYEPFVVSGVHAIARWHPRAM